MGEPLKALLEAGMDEPASPFSLERLLECDVEPHSDVQSDFDDLFVGDSNADSVGTAQTRSKDGSRGEHIHQVTWKDTTVLFIDIQGFTAACALMDAQHAGEWVQVFYEQVERQCRAHHVFLVEHRGDCCVCVDRHENQVEEILALAVDLHRVLAPTHTVRMGISTGPVCVLYGVHFLCVFGDTSEEADRLQALATPGRILFGISALREWVRETENDLPTTHMVKTKSTLHEYEVAEYDVNESLYV